MSKRDAPTRADEPGHSGTMQEAITHEFKNVLLVISGLSELILTQTDLDAATRRDVEEIQRATERAEHLTRRLFELVKSERPEFRRIDPNALLQRVEPMLARLVGPRISLRLVLAPALGRLLVDPIRVEQALLNLILNARDVMPDGGSLEVETARVEVGSDAPAPVAPGRYVSITVSDDGPGMSRETQERLFTPYFTTKGPDGGTGLGLFLVRSFATEAGGAVSVTSRLGSGTRVELLLPEAEEEAAPPAGQPGNPRV